MKSPVCRKVLFSSLIFFLPAGAPLPALEPVDYESEIQPIFDALCGDCHIGKSTSGVELTDYQKVLDSSGAQYGGPIVSPFRSAASPLWDKVARQAPRHGEREPRGRAPLTREQIDRIARWIDEGARRSPEEPIRGDLERDGSLNITDAVLILGYLFLGGSPPYCAPVADSDASGELDITDAVFILVHLFAGGPAPSVLSEAEKAACRGSGYTRYSPGCSSCHQKIEDIHGAITIACTDCHGGDYSTDSKNQAHVQPALPPIRDATTPPLDYDLPYQRFVNPSNLRVVRETCGTCHEPHIDWVLKSLMATGAGHYAGGLYQNGVSDSKAPTYGNFAIRDEDGVVPEEKGAVRELLDLIRYDPSLDPAENSTHYRAVPGQACARCHLWSRGKGYRGATGVDGTYRADGCAACHMIYDNDGRSASADTAIDHVERGHPLVHQVTRAIPTEQCVHCHYRGARIGLSFSGLSQMPPRLPSGPGVPGTTEVKFDGNYHYADPETNPPDIHRQYELHCIDCHTQAEIMGDGNIYGHMDQATKITCSNCHGLPGKAALLADSEGKALPNASRLDDGTPVITSKVTGWKHIPPQVKDIVDPASPNFNPKAARGMNDHHLKESGGLECHACHSAWMPNCFGCHFERDERRSGLNLMTREMESGKVATDNRVFVTLKHFAMGRNGRGKVSPYIVGCQPMADVTGPDGSKKLEFAMPRTANGLSGLALNPVHPHTIRSRGEVRACAECHRSPASLGLGSGNYSLARKYAFLAAEDGVRIYQRDASPGDPVLVKTLQAGRPLALAAAPNVVTGETDHLVVAAGAAGLRVYDFRAGIPENPLASLAGEDFIDVSRAARYVYAVVRGSGVRIYDNLDPAVLEPVASLAIPAAVRAVPSGVHLYVAAGGDGLVVADISDHRAPRIAGSLAGMNAVDVVVYSHYQIGPGFALRAYVADPDYGVRVVDLLPDPWKPRLAGGIELPGASGLDTYTRYLQTDGQIPSREHDYLYVAAGGAGLSVFDITNPDAPFEAASVVLGGIALDVDVASQIKPPGVDDYALVANGELGLQVLDVSDPRTPVLLKSAGASGASRAFIEVQQMDRFVDEQGNTLKENSHPGAAPLTRSDIIRILKADIGN